MRYCGQMIIPTTAVPSKAVGAKERLRGKGSYSGEVVVFVVMWSTCSRRYHILVKTATKDLARSNKGHRFRDTCVKAPWIVVLFCERRGAGYEGTHCERETKEAAENLRHSVSILLAAPSKPCIWGVTLVPEVKGSYLRNQRARLSVAVEKSRGGERKSTAVRQSITNYIVLRYYRSG